MNILFLTMNSFESIDIHNIYSDLMKVFIAHGHYPYIVTPREKKTGENTVFEDFDGYSILKVRIGNISNVSFFEKGISTVFLETHFKKAFNKYLINSQFDLILYSTPPITLAGVVKTLKKKYNSTTYLMLKDIFPQNAIDIELFSAKSPIAKFFRRKERRFYRLSDKLGCMSQANADYVLRNNPDIPKDKVEILPNAIILNPEVDRKGAKSYVRAQYNVPDGAVTFLFGGNLGKPQGIPFMIECLHAVKNRTEFFFIVCGQGSEYHLLEEYKKKENPINLCLINFLPKKEYDELASGCDVGLIFLDHRFTIPNYPSRILSYMENSMPVICSTDPNTDVGNLVEENNFGFSCESNSVADFVNCLESIKASDIHTMGKNAREACERLFSVEECYNKIINVCNNKKGFSTFEKQLTYTLERCWFSSEPQTKSDLVRFMRVDKPIKGCCVQNDPFKTVWSDLRKSEDEILAGASKTIKYEVNKCMKEDVTVSFTPDEAEVSFPVEVLDEFEVSYIEFAKSLDNDELLEAYDRHRLEVLMKGGHLLISKASALGINVYHVYAWGCEASCLLFSVSNFRTDSSLSNLAGRMNKMLHIKDMRWLREKGVYWYDWGNISRLGQQSGIDQFKVSFGGEIVEQYNVLKGMTFKGKLLVFARKFRKALFHA